MAWAVVIAALLGYEGYALATPASPGDTLSEWVWHWSREYPLVPFLAGGVMGHFFWQKRRKDGKETNDN